MHIVTVQSSFQDVIASVPDTEPEDQFWVCRRPSTDSDQEYYSVHVTKDGFQGEGAEFAQKGNRRFSVAIDDSCYALQGARRCIDTAKEDVLAVALTSDNTRLIVGKTNGDIVQYDVATQAVLHEVIGAHFLSVSHVVVFPSDKVFLSIGEDFQAKLWSLDSTTASRTFAQHHISDVALIGKGRNFLMSSFDGSVKLWECGAGEVVAQFKRIDNLNDPATCIAVQTVDKGEDASGLFECSDKVVYVGYESGVIQQFSVGGRYQTPVKLFNALHTPVTALCVFNDLLVAGYATGQVVLWDLQTGNEINSTHFESCPIENMRVVSHNSDSATVVLSNGPEVLLRVKIGILGTFEHSYMVGMAELFVVRLVHSNRQQIVVASKDEVGFFDV